MNLLQVQAEGFVCMLSFEIFVIFERLTEQCDALLRYVAPDSFSLHFDIHNEDTCVQFYLYEKHLHVFSSPMAIYMF